MNEIQESRCTKSTAHAEHEYTCAGHTWKCKGKKHEDYAEWIKKGLGE